MSYSDPLIAIERELAKHPVQTFKIYFSKPHSVSVHPQARDLDKSHVGDLVISFTKGIDRSSAQPMLAILQSAGNSYVSAHQNIDPQKLPILLISGQHRMRALQRLSWDRRYQAEAWWTVKVYDADLETDLGSAFRLLMVRENLCTPLVSKPATTGDLFSAYQKIVQDTKFLEYLKESKRKPGAKKKDQSPETLLSAFTRAFMTCYDDQISYPLLEELMKNEIFRQCLHIENYRAMTIHRLPHLASSIVKQIIEFWELSGYLEGDPSKHPKALLDKVATIRCPTLERAQSWVECDMNWNTINEGPQSSKLQLYGTRVKWIFGQRLPIPNILGSGYIQEMMAGAGKLVDAIIYCLHPSENIAFNHLEIRELFLSELKGEDRSKFEHAALRFSQLLNVPSRFRTVYAHGTLGDSVSALLTRPEWYDFMEQCPHQSARNWLSDHPRPLRSQAIAPLHVDNVGLIRTALAKKTTTGLEDEDSDSESDLTTLSSLDDEPMEEESCHNVVTISPLRSDSPSSLEAGEYPNLPYDKDNDSPEHIAHSEEDRPEYPRPQVCSQGIQTEVPSGTNEIVNTLLKLGETRFPLLHDLLVGLLEVKDERWKDTISQMRDHLRTLISSGRNTQNECEDISESSSDLTSLEDSSDSMNTEEEGAENDSRVSCQKIAEISWTRPVAKRRRIEGTKKIGNYSRQQSESPFPFPEGPPTEESHHEVVRWSGITTTHMRLGVTDNLTVHLFLEEESAFGLDVWKFTPMRCPDPWNSIARMKYEQKRELQRLEQRLLKYPSELWESAFALCRHRIMSIGCDKNLATIFKDPEFVRSMSRYINLKKSSRVRLGKVLFGDKKRSASLKAPQFCIQAKQAIPRGTYIWELNGVISADIVEGPTISSMEAHKSQNLAKGPRLFAGPARFINHSCVPNATLYPVPNMHCLVAFSTRKISPGEEITISYGSRYWSGSAHCCCRTCSGCDPLYSVEMDLGPPV